MYLRYQSVIKSVDVRGCRVVTGEELKPQRWDLNAKQFLQGKVVKGVMSEVMKQQKEQLFGECLLGTQLFTS